MTAGILTARRNGMKCSNVSSLLTVQGMMESSQPNPLNNHQPRAGTKSRECGCQCEMCVGYANKNRIQKKIALKELQDELDNY